MLCLELQVSFDGTSSLRDIMHSALEYGDNGTDIRRITLNWSANASRGSSEDLYSKMNLLEIKWVEEVS